ncbi:lipase member N-like isoform X2 [Hemicordylus capensis]|uniref:lipase member N-like isoform X2 n=1 Tax=Hemicordylus capensis TaxID=884348 RepID=UPI002303153B|nr:lipase member N-like isoform X2 [Hemicordylus capensis]
MMWSFLIVVCFSQGIFGLQKLRTSEPLTEHTVDPECFMNASEIIRYHGYPSEEHHVETEDGYILTVLRIPHGRDNGANKGPRSVVFLQHAFITDASTWISNLPNNSFGFILADAGFDVWLGNSRGNSWSLNHKTFNTNEQRFWEFSLHEMGYYDIPAVLNFVLNKTGQEQLYYVGHSEGATIGFIAFSTWPKLADRIKVFFALGPITTLTYTSNTVINFFSIIPKILFQTTQDNKGIFHNFAYVKKAFASFCTYQPKFCAKLLSFVAGYNIPNLNILLHVKQLQAYDYGFQEKNMEKYNQTMPPIYKLEDIKIPIAFWTGGEDLFASSKDVAMLRSQLRNLIYEKHIPEWAHLDFIWGLDAAERMYPEIIEIMKNYS